MSSDSVQTMLFIAGMIIPLLLGVAVVTGRLAQNPRVRASGWLLVIWAAAAGSTVLTFVLLPVMYMNPYGIRSPTLGVLYVVPFAVGKLLMLTVGDSDPVALIWVVPVVTWLQFAMLLFIIGALLRAFVKRRTPVARERLTSGSSGRRKR